MTTVYKIYDDEFEEICGIEQLKKFALDQVHNSQDDFIEENLKDYYDIWQDISELANKILFEKYTIQTVDEAKKILSVRNFDVEEIEIY